MASPDADLTLDIGEGFHLRPWRRGDEPALVRHANNPRVVAFVRDRFPNPYHPSDARSFIDQAAAADPVLNFAVVSPEGEAVGSVGLAPGEDTYRHSAEIGYWLGEAFWGRGIAARGVAALTRYAFEELGFIRVFASVMEANTASVRVVEKAGYGFEGRMVKGAIKGGKLYDVLLYARIKS